MLQSALPAHTKDVSALTLYAERILYLIVVNVTSALLIAVRSRDIELFVLMKLDSISFLIISLAAIKTSSGGC